ncbi:hypothetical protein EDD85DRAFT_791993 [Armillaria nabsnona]|nr:hypothetical protein EDD85DRAFT_791993 [Armillaria nabsnona]
MSTVLPPADAVKALAAAGAHLQVLRRWEDSLALASVSLLLFEYLITFAAEVDYVWSKPRSFVSMLYIVNRYFGPMAITVCMIALFDSGISEESVYALHERSKIILTLHVSIWLVQTSLMSFTLAHSGRMAVSWSLIAALVGVWRRPRRHECSLLTLIARDGILYFGAVVASNTLWTVTGLVLPSDLKNVWAFMSTVLTSILIARITVSLRSHESQSVIVGPKMRSNSRSPNITESATELCKSSPQDDVELQQFQLH